ncbi:MAG: hypothetical protein QM662_18860 [Gordonia sp. (in: high G+C Gram-positive bacteria)]
MRASKAGPATSPRQLLAAERAARRDLRRAVDELAEAEYASGAPVSRGRWVALAVLVLAAVAAAVVGGTAWIRAATDRTDADYAAVAVSTTALLLSPDATRPDRVRDILADATGAFADEFGASAQAYTEFVRHTGTVAAATVDGAGVTARTDDQATVLVIATVTYRPAGGAAAESNRRFRLQVLVEPGDGALKVAAVRYLP